MDAAEHTDNMIEESDEDTTEQQQQKTLETNDGVSKEDMEIIRIVEER